MQCDRCDSELMLLIDCVGSRQHYSCQACSATRSIHVTYHVTETDGSVRDLGQLYELSGRWIDNPKIEQLKRVSEIFPQLLAGGFSALWRTAVANEPINFGVFTKEDADSFVNRLQKIGLSTSLEMDKLSVPLRQD